MMAPLSETERSAILDAEVYRYIVAGYRLTARSPTTAQLVKPKSFDSGCAIFGLLFLLVGLLIYLLMYLAERDKAVYLSVDDTGVITIRGDAIPESSGSDRWACDGCGYRNAQSRPWCKRCRADRATGV